MKPIYLERAVQDLRKILESNTITSDAGSLAAAILVVAARIEALQDAFENNIHRAGEGI